MALPVDDPFTRIDAGTLGANWTQQAAGFTILTNACKATSTSDDNGSRWSADALPADQYSQCLLTAVQDGGPMVHSTGDGPNLMDGYLLSCQAGASTIQRLDNDSGTVLQSGLGGWASGTTAKLYISGTTLRAYKNGAQVGTDQVDATYTTGSIGLYNFGSGAIYDNFFGDAVTTAVTAKPTGPFVTYRPDLP